MKIHTDFFIYFCPHYQNYLHIHQTGLQFYLFNFNRLVISFSTFFLMIKTSYLYMVYPIFFTLSKQQNAYQTGLLFSHFFRTLSSIAINQPVWYTIFPFFTLSKWSNAYPEWSTIFPFSSHYQSGQMLTQTATQFSHFFHMIR